MKNTCGIRPASSARPWFSCRVLSGLFLFLAGCQPMSFDGGGSGDFSVSSQDIFSGKEDAPSFTSDKLNLVFVLDTQPGMEKFYETPFLDKSFVRGLAGYQVKAAHTNAAVDETLTRAPLSEVGRKCGLKTAAKGAGLTLAGFFASPFFLPFGVQGLAPCFSGDVFKKSYPKVNGEFLPFELNGKELSRHLMFSEANAEMIFHDTVTKGTSGAFRSYDAPQNQNEGVFPLYAALLSMAKGGSFFEEDAAVVFVVVTAGDASAGEELGADDLRKNFSKLYGSADRTQTRRGGFSAREESGDEEKGGAAADRLHLIPIAINKGDSLCEMRLREMGVESPRAGVSLDSVAQDMGKESLNICASPARLSGRLLAEIRPLLSPSAKPSPDAAALADPPPWEREILSDWKASDSSFLQQPSLEDGK